MNVTRSGLGVQIQPEAPYDCLQDRVGERPARQALPSTAAFLLELA
jgi:hypothetical protein